MSQLILFVINPIAGDTNKDHVEPTIRIWAQSSGCTCQIYNTTGNNDLNEIQKILNSDNYDLLISVGGDGTLKTCVAAVVNRDIRIGMIPMGSANGMAQSLDLPTDLKAGLQLIDNGQYRNIDVLCFNDDDLAIHISDFGMNARLVKRFEESERRGFLGYAEHLYDQFTRQEQFEVSVKTKQLEKKYKAVMVAIANANRYGTGALLNNIGQMDDGLFEICIIRELSLSNMAEHIVSLPDQDSEHLEIIQAEEAEITLDQKVPFQVDGEVRPESDSLKIKILPGAVRFLIP